MSISSKNFQDRQTDKTTSFWNKISYFKTKFAAC